MIKRDAVLSASPALTIFDERFHLGVIGIVAQRLVEQFHRPAAVMAPGEALLRGKLVPVVKGSVRSVRGFNVAEVLESLRELLITGGGHEAAGGFSLVPENLSAFQTAFSNAAGRLLTAEHWERRLLADAEASLAEVDFDLVQAMAKLGPFGMGNPTPVIVSHNLTIESVYSVGEEHVKLRVSDGVAVANAVAWRFRGHPLMKKGERVSLAYNPEINTYQGVSSVQLNVKEIWT
jgi:single-stranded-DNA-specific exonuclease